MNDFYNLIFEIFKFVYFELKEYLKNRRPRKKRGRRNKKKISK